MTSVQQEKQHQQEHKRQEGSSGDDRGHGGTDDKQRKKPPPGQQPNKQQQQKRWARPPTAAQCGPTATWTDQYTKRPMSSRAYTRVTQEELDGIVQRLRQSTVSSTGAEALRGKQFEYPEPAPTKTNPRLERKRPEPRSDKERDEIAQRLFSAKTRAWVARREKNPNTRVHYSTDFTII